MEIRKNICENCKREHIEKIYINKSEAITDLFIEYYFPKVWDMMKEKYKEIPLEEFCNELVFTSIYNFHKNIRKFKVDKRSIKQNETKINLKTEE